MASSNKMDWIPFAWMVKAERFNGTSKWEGVSRWQFVATPFTFISAFLFLYFFFVHSLFDIFLLLLLLIVAKCIEMQCVTAASEQLSLGASSGAIAQQQERNEEDCREIDRKRPMPCATTIGAFHSNGDVIYCVDATITYCLYNMVFASIHCISIGFFFLLVFICCQVWSWAPKRHHTHNGKRTE